jgi:predicted nucleic acid-binding protein
MIIISDTTPIRYLVEIEEAHILEELFGKVIVPLAVFNELQHRKTPLAIKEWIANAPGWLEVKQATRSMFTPERNLDIGEIEAFALAIELNATLILLDDRLATKEAVRLGIPFLSTFAILEAAARKNLLDLPAVIGKMRKTTFRLPSEEDIEAMIDRDRRRKQHSTS